VARYLVLWRMNPVAPWPTDPSKVLELNEKMWAAIDDLIRKGLVKEMGGFLDGWSGYAIGEGEATDVYKYIGMFIPYMQGEVHEVIPYEKTKEIDRARLKALVEAAKK